MLTFQYQSKIEFHIRFQHIQVDHHHRHSWCQFLLCPFQRSLHQRSQPKLVAKYIHKLFYHLKPWQWSLSFRFTSRIYASPLCWKIAEFFGWKLKNRTKNMSKKIERRYIGENTYKILIKFLGWGRRSGFQLYSNEKYYYNLLTIS